MILLNFASELTTTFMSIHLRRLIITGLCAFAFSAHAQTNVFLDRNYWKSAPDAAKVALDISSGNNPSAMTAAAFDPVVYAILEKAPDATVHYLLTQPGNEVNKITHDGRTYIFWAAYVGNTDLMDYLQKKGAKTDIIEDHGYTIANFAASSGQSNTKVYDLCEKFGANFKKDLDHEGANALLLVAASAKDLSLIDYFTAKGVALKSKDAHGNSVLNYAAKSGNRPVMEQLLKKGATFTDNAMIMAAQGTRANTNTLETYTFLESKGVKANATGENGENPLHYIVRKDKQAEVVAYFLSKGVDVNQTNKDGNSVFMNAAAYNPDLAIVTLLAERTKNLNATNGKGQTALALAVQSNSPEIVTFLLEKGASVILSDVDGNNLTHYLVNSYSAKKADFFDTKLKMLQSKDFDVNEPSKNGNTLYHLAVAKGDLALLKRAKELGADINKKNAEHLTALHKAAMIAKNDEILKFLIQAGAATTEKTDMNETAYDLALENEALQKAKISIEFLKS